MLDIIFLFHNIQTKFVLFLSLDPRPNTLDDDIILDKGAFSSLTPPNLIGSIRTLGFKYPSLLAFHSTSKKFRRNPI